MATVLLTQQEKIHVDNLVKLLSPAEREVIELVVAGDMNKAIARKLKVGERTVSSFSKL